MIFSKQNIDLEINNAVPDLSWVNEWIANVKDYIFVRAEDNVFIQRPNKAFHLNDQGISIMQQLLDGKSIENVLSLYGHNPRAGYDINIFLQDLRKMLKNGIDDTYESSAVEKKAFSMEFSKFPVLSEIAITYKCNAKCLFCYAGCGSEGMDGDKNREMSLDEIKSIINKIYYQAKVPSVSFTGGEPTLRPDLPEMVEYARSIGMRVNLITNGTLSTDRLVNRLKNAGLQSAQISLEGAASRIHDRMTCVNGSFNKTIDAVKRYRDADITVHTNTTLTNINKEDALEIPGLVKELGMEAFSMNLMIPTGNGAINDTIGINYRDIGALLKKISSVSKKHAIDFKWYSPVPMCMFNTILHGFGNKGCSACDGLISINPEGQVLPCASYDKPLGSLLSDSFEMIWNKPETKQIRTKSFAHGICRACEYFHICNGACPLYWRQTGYDELVSLHKRNSGVEAAHDRYS